MDLAQTRPRFRTDLVAQPVEEGGQRFVDVTDPDSGKTFRFYEIEYSIACAMDGQRDLDSLVDWAHAELGLEPSPDELATVVTTLAELGYLEDVPPSGLDLDLGHAGMSEVPLPDHGPAAPDIELGVAGVMTASEDERGFNAADVPLGVAGNEGLTMEPAPFDDEAGAEEISMEADADDEVGATEQSFAGLMDEEPTRIKPGKDAAALKAAMEAASPPAIPPLEPIAEDSAYAAEPQPTLRPVGGSDAEEDGPTNLPPPASDFDDEVSVDLTDHLHLGPDAVKEAVRQSKMMPVVDTPMAAQSESDHAAADAPPVQLPEKPISVSRPPVQEAATPLPPPVPEPTSSTALIVALAVGVLLLLAVVAAALDIGGIRTKLLGGGEPVGTVQPPPAAEPNIAQQEPQVTKTELPTAALEQADGAPVEIKAAQAGMLHSILASGTEVKEGDLVAKLDGFQKLERFIADARSDKNRYQKRIEKFTAKKEAAEAAGNESDAAKQQKAIDEQLAKIAAKDKDMEESEVAMEALMLRAPAAGAIETSLAAKAKVEADQVVFAMKGSPVLRANFTVQEQKELSAGTEVQLASKADDDKTLECMVTKVDGQQVTVECPADGGLEAGAEVVLRP